MVSSPQRRWRLFGGRGDSSPEPEPDRGGDSEQASPAAAPGAPPEDLGAALDLIGYMLRLLGQVPVLPDEPASADLRRTYDGWARHILTLAPPPPADTPTPRRAWQALAQFLTEQRHR